MLRRQADEGVKQLRTDMLKEALEAYRAEAEGPMAERLRFLEGLAEIQSEIAAGDSSFTLPDADTASEAMVTGQPLFLSVPPALPRDEFIAAVERVAAYVADEAGLEEEQAAALRAADFATELTAEALDSATRSVDEFVVHMVAKLGAGEDEALKPATVAYVLLSAIVPFFSSSASRLLAALPDVDLKTWTLGTCPVCGSPASIGFVGESTKLQGGERKLWCGLCHTEWAYDRIRCVRCGSRSSDKLRYVHIDGDPAHRVHLCDECHGYARFVFTDELSKPLSLVVEDAVSTAMDSVALSQGYTPSGDGGAKG